jgi:Spy/CpxP family protein refolding chaperone
MSMWGRQSIIIMVITGCRAIITVGAFGYPATGVAVRPQPLEVKKMKNKIFLIFFLCMCFIVTGQPVFAGPPEGPPMGHVKMKERIVTLRNWRLMEELDLQGEKAQKVFSILDAFDKEREKLIKQRRDIKRELRLVIESPPAADPKAKTLMNEFFKINSALSAIPEKEINALGEVFDTREQAKFLLFQERFIRDIKKMAHERFRRKR